ncbi:MAG: hypothetical protein ACK4NY_15375 [Spirosomataceae bacterium]
MLRSFTVLGFSVLTFTMVLSCSKTDEGTDPKEKSSFDLMQDKILTVSCAVSGCHLSETDATFKQHGLVLAAGKSYANLVGVAPKNANALSDNLLRVKAFKSLESLLYHKLLFDNSHHAGKSYGSPMPLGMELLSQGQIEFVRRWIEAGAPKTGNVVDASLLDDKTPSLAPFSALEVPAAGTGFQMRLEPFTVNPNFERELFVRKAVGNTETVYVNRFKISMRPNSHHFILYGFRNNSSLPQMNVIRDLRNPDNSLNLVTSIQMSNHIFYFGGSEQSIDYTFPPGTAVELAPNQTFDMNAHNFNKTDKPLTGEVYINLYTTPKANVKNVVKVIDFGNQNITLPPKTKTVVSKDFTFNTNVKIVTLFSHTHKLGEKFEILIKGGARNGEVVYTSTDWEHPLRKDLSPYISLKKGEGLTSRITYNNTSNQTVRFGLTSEDEMGIIFGYYFEE